MLELKDINKTFNKGTVNEKVLFSDFNLQIPKGQFVCVVGSNGSGKTTLLNVVSGDMFVDSGKVFVDGEDFTNLKNFVRAKKIARVFQNPAMGTCPSMTIIENLSIADNKLRPFNLTKGLNTKRRDFYKTTLQQLGLGLENRLDTKVATLSGGQRQALALIMATLVTPDLLLLDEHTAALDPKSSDIVMELTQKIIEEKKITTLMVTHNLRYATQYGNRCIMMHEGTAVLDVCDMEKKNQSIDDLLKIFNEISIECGN
ncbi:MAG: ATP-binding cassette domain-containing protein [Eubacteriales bacterium]|nr:ATP-binding cassette domain-containing protein [Eubacteriales bacterium]